MIGQKAIAIAFNDLGRTVTTALFLMDHLSTNFLLLAKK